MSASRLRQDGALDLNSIGVNMSGSQVSERSDPQPASIGYQNQGIDASPPNNLNASDSYQPPQNTSDISFFTPVTDSSPVFANNSFVDYGMEDLMDPLLADTHNNTLELPSPTFNQSERVRYTNALNNAQKDGADYSYWYSQTNTSPSRSNGLKIISMNPHKDKMNATMSSPVRPTDSSGKVSKSRRTSKSSKVAEVFSNNSKADPTSSSQGLSTEDEQVDIHQILNTYTFSDLSDETELSTSVEKEHDLCNANNFIKNPIESIQDVGSVLDFNIDELGPFSNQMETPNSFTDNFTGLLEHDSSQAPTKSNLIPTGVDRKLNLKTNIISGRSHSKKSLRKASSFAGFPNTVNGKSQTKDSSHFSLSDLSSTFPVNSVGTNNISFIMENNVAASSSDKSRKKSTPKSSDRPVLKKATSFMENISKSGYPAYTTGLPNISTLPSPKVLKNMKSGMVSFQLKVNKNQAK